MVTANLQQALDAYNSTNRSRYPLNGCFVTNLEAVKYYLTEATAEFPSHFGLPITVANMQTFQGEIVKALDGFHHCLGTARTETEKCQVLTYLIVWYQYAGNNQQVRHYLNRLHQLNHQYAATVKSLLTTLLTILAQPICYLPPAIGANRLHEPHAIITLGYVLNDDGSMAPPLLQRLELTLQLSKTFPESLIIVTGGLAKQGKTESQQMKYWLIERGIAPNKIIEENQATSTIDNAKLSLDLLRQQRIQIATLVSASIHVHRSQILFETLQQRADTPPILFNHCAVDDSLSADSFPAEQTTKNCYIDALRGFGLPAFNCEPFVQI